MKPSILSRLIKVVARSSSLEKLSLANTQFDETAMKNLSRYLGRSVALKDLNL